MTQSSQAVTVGENGADRQSEYIDLIDILVWFWRSQFWVLSGIILSLSIASIVAVNKSLSVAVTILPLIAEQTTATTPEAIVNQFNALINRTDFQSLFLSNLEEQDRNTILLHGIAPFQLVPTNSSNFNLEMRQTQVDLSGQQQVKIFTALMGVARGINKEIVTKYEEQKKHPMMSEKPESELNIAALASAQAEIEAGLRIQLFHLESKIAQKTGIHSPPSQGALGSPEEGILKQLALSDGKLSETERTQFIKDYSQIMGLFKATQLKYEPAIRELSSILLTFSKQFIDQVAAAANVAPIFVLDEVAYKVSVMSKTNTRIESKKPAFYTFSVILGALAGCVAYAIKCYLVQNRNRLKAAITESNRQ